MSDFERVCFINPYSYNFKEIFKLNFEPVFKINFNQDTIKPFRNQVYEDLLRRHDERNLFEDTLFPASNQSMYYSQRCPQGVKWLRPKVNFSITNIKLFSKILKLTNFVFLQEARQNPQFVIDGFDRCGKLLMEKNINTLNNTRYKIIDFHN